MVEIGSGVKRKLEDVKLSRYACYLIVQNGDPSKPVIANGQTCQTRYNESICKKR
jgi:DNA-damage-inducible protein D